MSAGKFMAWWPMRSTRSVNTADNYDQGGRHMTRKLLILGAIAALFTVLTVAPALAIAVSTGPDGETIQEPLLPVEDGIPNDAHGPACGNDGVDCPHNEGSDDAAGATSDVPGLAYKETPIGDGGVNLGAWNAVFESNVNSAICGVTASDC
jgi:hypothetical protein